MPEKEPKPDHKTDRGRHYGKSFIAEDEVEADWSTAGPAERTSVFLKTISSKGKNHQRRQPRGEQEQGKVEKIHGL